MSYGHGGGFALIVVLFILLIIVGTSFDKKGFDKDKGFGDKGYY